MISEQLLIFAFAIITASGSALRGSCNGNEQCGTLDTYCKNGTCVCKDDFIESSDNCIQLATPRIACSHKSNCSTIMGQKGFCKNNQCVCKSFHHVYKQQCVKSKGLDEDCENGHQCYCGQDCSDKIECASETCTCKPGFKKFSRRCVLDPSVVNVSPTTPSGSVSFLTFYVIPDLLKVTFFIKILDYLY